MNSAKSENCVKLFRKLQIFGFDGHYPSRINQIHDGDGRLFTLSATNVKDHNKILDGRQLLMKHILDSISALRYIHEEYISILEQQCSPAISVEASAAKDRIFIKAVSLSLEGIFNPLDREERVDLLLNAFPGDGQDFLPLHWAMLAGAGIDDKSVEIVYDSNPLALQQYHQQPSGETYWIDKDKFNYRVSWTAGHFLCAAIQDGPTMASRLRKYIKLNSEAFTIKPLSYRSQNIDSQYTALDLSAIFCPNKFMIQEIIQLDPSHLKRSNIKFGLRPLGIFLESNMIRMSNWKDIAQCYLDADCSLIIVADAIEGCFKTFYNERIKNIAALEVEVFEFISSLLVKYIEVIDYYDCSILHRLMSHPKVPSSLCIQLINLILHYNKDVIKMADDFGCLPIHEFMDNYDKGCSNRLAVFNYLISYYPRSIKMTTSCGDNILHNNTGDYLIVAQVCKKHPKLLLKTNNNGTIPLHSLLMKLDDVVDEFAYTNVIKVMCEANPEICKISYVFDAEENEEEYEMYDGYLALHFLIAYIREQDCTDNDVMKPFISEKSFISDILRLLLSIYPAAVDIPAANMVKHLILWYQGS